MAKILLIDDDAQMRKLITEFMSLKGHEVIPAKDGAFGVSMSALELPDIILLDMMMPVMDGPQALDMLKREPGLNGIPVVAVSANSDPDFMEQVKNAGAVAYLTKPVDLTELLQCLEGTLTFRAKDS